MGGSAACMNKTHLVSWWAGRYSRRGLPLRGRGAYGPVLTHGPRVASLSLRGQRPWWAPFWKYGGAIMIKPGSRPGGRWKCAPPFGGCVSGQFTTMFSMIYVIEGKSRNVRLLSQKGAGRSPEDRSLQSKGAAVGGDLRKRHLRPRWGLGFLRGALIQSQNQIS